MPKTQAKEDKHERVHSVLSLQQRTNLHCAAGMAELCHQELDELPIRRPTTMQQKAGALLIHIASYGCEVTEFRLLQLSQIG